MPSTAEYWDVEGYVLNDEAQNLRSWGGSREEPPPLRGDNQVIPYKAGAKWVEKIPGERTLVLDGWMTDLDTPNLRRRWKAFRSLLWRPDELFPITRRWLDDDGNLLSGTGMAEYVSGLSPEIQAGGTRLDFKVTLNMPDPFFYSAVQTINFTSTGAKVVDILGDYGSEKVQATFTGAQTGSTLSVFKGAAVHNKLTYSALTSGTALVNSETWRATEGVTPSSYKVSHEGHQRWLWLPPSTARIDFARASGSGTASIQYAPAWI